MRDINVSYFALSELNSHCAFDPGATRLTLFGACPWLSYVAPSALQTVAFIFRAFGAANLAFIFRAFGLRTLAFMV